MRLSCSYLGLFYGPHTENVSTAAGDIVASTMPRGPSLGGQAEQAGLAEAHALVRGDGPCPEAGHPLVHVLPSVPSGSNLGWQRRQLIRAKAETLKG
jgi:hypothetical protein